MAERKKKESQDTQENNGISEKKTTPKKHFEPSEEGKFYSVIFFASGILSALMILVEGTSGWKLFHNFLLGMFGVSVIGVPIILIYTALLMGKGEKDRSYVVHRALWGLGLTVLISSIIQLYFIGDFKGDKLSEIISSLYSSGKAFRGGGVLSIIFAGPLLAFFGVAGARIFTAVILCVFIMMLLDIGIYQLFEYIVKPFKIIWESLVSLSQYVKGETWDDGYYDEADDEEAEYDDQEDYEEIIMIEEKPKKKKAERKKKNIQDDIPADDSFGIDVPIADEQDTDEQLMLPEIFTNGTSQADYGNSRDESIDIELYEEQNNSDEIMTDGDDSEKDDDLLESLIKREAKKKEKPDNSEDADENQPCEITYSLPPLDLLTVVDSSANAEAASAEMHEKAEIIVNTLKSFGVAVKISDIYRGPSITRYEIQPGTGVKVSRIKGLEDDISLYLAAQGVRIEAPVPGKACVGIEVPNTTKDMVTIREILSSRDFKNSKSKLTFAVGKDIAGNIILGDIAKMPHVIIAGTTGSGKSVCTRSIIMSILYNTTPEEVRIILIDPKIVEFKTFEGIPQLLIPVITDPKKSAGALNWAVNEMIRRYQIFADNYANDLRSYNEIAENDEILQKMPQIVIFIDELADLMLVAGKEVEDSICRLAQMGRASGIHLVIATQRPTTDVITGLIKANIPSRIALSVKSQIDSRTIIDMAGADKLLGNGDMLYYPIGASKPIRVQGCFASSKDIEKTVEFVKSQMPEEYDSNIMKAVNDFVPATKERDVSDSSSGNSDEDIVEQAMGVAVENGQLSTSMLQRKLKLGYARAARIMDELEEMGVIGPSEGAKPRKVLMSKLQFDEMRLRKQNK